MKGFCCMEKGFTALGLMSGTSLDGIDGAIVRTDGTSVLEHGACAHLTYSDENRQILQDAVAEALAWKGGSEPHAIYRAAALVSDTHARLVRRLLDIAGLGPRDVDFLGFPGQTILHQPQLHKTVQIGDAQALADLSGIDVVADFRLKDVAEGGQGAPLVPLYHQALVRASALQGPVAVVNIGGVSNITYIKEAQGSAQVSAFDTGPGNGLIDEWVAKHSSLKFDQDGTIASMGQADRDALNTMLANRYFHRPPPKSLDRYDFTTDFVSRLGIEDGAATLTAFTAAAIARAPEHLPETPRTWVICGGGRHNLTLMALLKDGLPGKVLRAEDLNWPGDEMEAEAFGFLAVRSYLGLPLSLPTTTGVPFPCTGGKVYEASR